MPPQPPPRPHPTPPPHTAHPSVTPQPTPPLSHDPFPHPSSSLRVFGSSRVRTTPGAFSLAFCGLSRTLHLGLHACQTRAHRHAFEGAAALGSPPHSHPGLWLSTGLRCPPELTRAWRGSRSPVFDAVTLSPTRRALHQMRCAEVRGVGAEVRSGWVVRMGTRTMAALVPPGTAACRRHSASSSLRPHVPERDLVMRQGLGKGRGGHRGWRGGCTACSRPS